MDTRESISVLARAAQEVESPDVRRGLLRIIEGLTGEMTEAPAGEPYTGIDVSFPLKVWFQSHHLGREIAGKLYPDGSIEIEGERYGTPSSNRLCDKYRNDRTNMWRVWKFKDRQGNQYIIDVLRVHKLVGPGYRENGKQFRRLIGK